MRFDFPALRKGDEVVFDGGSQKDNVPYGYRKLLGLRGKVIAINGGAKERANTHHDLAKIRFENGVVDEMYVSRLSLVFSSVPYVPIVF